MTLSRILFEPPQVVMLPGAAEALQASGEDPILFLDRHITGDWGEIRHEEIAANTLALAMGGELVSRYRTTGGKTLCILTEADRSKTYLFLKDEGEAMETNAREPNLLFGSFTSSVGLALGELLILTGRQEELLEHLREIHVTARATIMCAEAGSEAVTISRPGVSLSDAALKAVRAWSMDPQDPADLDDAMALLADVLKEMGVLRDVADQDDPCEW
jgi:hypothetical protein